jgi:similar to stage IV sporulation protein
LADFLRGWVKLKVSGDYPERFFNLSMKRGIKIFAVKRVGEAFFVCMQPSDFFLVREAARKARVRVRIVGRYGLPFVWQRWRRRKILLGGLVLFFLALYFLSRYIWFVEIVAADAAIKEDVTAVLQEAGIGRGTLRKSVDNKSLVQKIMSENPNVAWAGIDVSGTKMTVNIVAKSQPPLVPSPPVYLRAKRDGEIVRVIALSGKSLVEKGEIVKKGDALIVGDSEEAARGMVIARTVYEASASAPYYALSFKRTGEKSFGFKLFLGGQLVFELDRRDKYLHSEWEEYRKKVIGWRNRDSFVEFIIDNYYELAANYSVITAEDAEQAALKMAEEALQQSIPQDARIYEKSVAKKEHGDNYCTLTLRADAEENIAQMAE